MFFDDDYFAVYHFVQIKPLNEKEILKIARNYSSIITIEEGSVKGGFGSAINQIISKNTIKTKVINLGVPDEFIEHATVQEQFELCGIDIKSLQTLFKKLSNVQV